MFDTRKPDGTGKGSSVLEMIKAFEEVSGKSIPLKVTNRRAGDVATCYANVDLHWRETQTLGEMCASAWSYQNFL